MRAIRIVLLFLMLLLLMGCTSKDYTLHFNETMILQYGTNKNTIDLIERIGDVKVTDEMKENNILTYDNLVIECEEIDTSILTEYEVTYKTNDTENKLITKTVKIRDTSPPSIAFNGLDENNVLYMYKEDFDTYDFSRNVTVKDNYDSKPEVHLTINEIKGKDQYTVQITATDKFNNTATKEFMISIKKKEADQKKENTDTQSETSRNSNKKKNPSVGSSSQNQNSNTSSSKINSSIKEQNFYFGKIYEYENKQIECNIDNVSSICSSKLSKSGRSGSCVPLKDSNGIYIGMSLRFDQ